MEYIRSLERYAEKFSELRSALISYIITHTITSFFGGDGTFQGEGSVFLTHYPHKTGFTSKKVYHITIEDTSESLEQELKKVYANYCFREVTKTQ